MKSAQTNKRHLRRRYLIIIIPVRCFTCGKVIGDKWEEFARRVKAGEGAGKVLDNLGVTRYCCRRMLLSHVDIIDEVLKFYVEAGRRNQAEQF
jgi:DNA-directed RNA polymerase subunit N